MDVRFRVKTPDDRTPLIIAVCRRSTEMCKLLDHDPNFMHEFDSVGNLPVHYAAVEGLLDVLNLMIKNDRSMKNAKCRKGVTPIFFARLFGQYDIVKFLVDAGAEETEQEKEKAAIAWEKFLGLKCYVRNG
ncbi:hypothetical protein HK098_004052 [Nowakowskiella sp. JEL0407]|nr:hypothetical protein HK098_004052 [Nowakowskiella sp. JEL0407]